MRRAKPVCLLCRLQAVSPTSQARAIQCQQVATLYIPSSKHDALARPVERASRDAGNPGSSSQPPLLRKFVYENPQLATAGARISPTKITGKPSSSRVEALFQQIIQEQSGLPDTAGDESAPSNPPVDHALVKAIGELQEMVDGDTPVADAFSRFQTQIKPSVQDSGVSTFSAYTRVVLQLLEKLVEAKKADMFTAELPTVANIFRLYIEVDKLQPKQWAALVGELIRCIVREDFSTEARPVALRDAMLADLIDSWKVFSLPRDVVLTTGENELTNNFWFPKLDLYSLERFAKSGDFARAFNALFSYPLTQLKSSVAMLAIATIVVMRDESRCSAEIRDQATRFISKVASLISFVDSPEKDLRRQLLVELPELEAYVMGLWPDFMAYVGKTPPIEHGWFTEAYPISPSSGNLATRLFDPKAIWTRLSQVYKNRNAVELNNLWISFVGPEKKMSTERAKQIQQWQGLIDAFIREHAAFHQPEKAVAAWKLLGEVGLKPTVRTYNQMLDGLRRTGNISGIRNIWKKLIQSGLPLDTAVWTTRVGGLVECGDVEGGMLALKEMLVAWQLDPKTAVEPTIEPVNAAITALINSGRRSAVERILAWARSKGIEPDVYTFNIELRSLIRNGNPSEDIEKLFAAMQAQNIKANEATFTILLDAPLSTDQADNPEEQTRFVLSIAAAMKNSGLQLNMITYAKMIYVLLRANATSAAMSIVNEIYDRGLELTRHIYTILVQHFFAQTPPDLKSVHLIMKRRRRGGVTDMDIVFYDRLVSGFTVAGDTQTALEVFENAVSIGARVTLPILADLLSVLLRNGQHKEASMMVRLEKKRFEDLHTDAALHAAYWNHRFWHMAVTYQLLVPLAQESDNVGRRKSSI